MRIVLAAFMLTAAPALAATDTPKATVDAFFTAFGKGDLKAVAALHTAAPVIMDEVPPHLWQGANAFNTWLADLLTYDKAAGNSGGALTAGTPARVVTSGTRAYVALPVNYAFKAHGTPMHEAASMAFALTRTDAGWRIAGWSFASPAPIKP